MSEEDAGKAIVLIGAIVFIAWLLSQLFKTRENVPVYRCPRCGRVVRTNAPTCDFCRAPLVWRSDPSQHPRPSELMRWTPWIWGLVFLVSCIVAYAILSAFCSYMPPVNPKPIENFLALLDRMIFVTFGLIIARPLELAVSKEKTEKK